MRNRRFILWAMEQWVLFLCAAGIVVILVLQMSSPFDEGLNLIVIFITSASIFLGLCFTCFPFVVFYFISRYIGRKSTSLPISYARVVLALVIAMISWWLYYDSAQSIQGDRKSTAGLIFAVLPIYILIAGSILYGVLASFANNDAEHPL